MSNEEQVALAAGLVAWVLRESVWRQTGNPAGKLSAGSWATLARMCRMAMRERELGL